MTDTLLKLKGILDSKDPMGLSDLAINGHDLIVLGFVPGPELGVVLKKLLEIVLEFPGKNTVEILSKIAREFLDREKSSM